LLGPGWPQFPTLQHFLNAHVGDTGDLLIKCAHNTELSGYYVPEGSNTTESQQMQLNKAELKPYTWFPLTLGFQ
jgi:hypothetical protein